MSTHLYSSQLQKHPFKKDIRFYVIFKFFVAHEQLMYSFDVKIERELLKHGTWFHDYEAINPCMFKVVTSTTFSYTTVIPSLVWKESRSKKYTTCYWELIWKRLCMYNNHQHRRFSSPITIKIMAMMMMMWFVFIDSLLKYFFFPCNKM